jgi:hypothetical protein
VLDHHGQLPLEWLGSELASFEALQAGLAQVHVAHLNHSQSFDFQLDRVDSKLNVSQPAAFSNTRFRPHVAARRPAYPQQIEAQRSQCRGAKPDICRERFGMKQPQASCHHCNGKDKLEALCA